MMPILALGILVFGGLLFFRICDRDEEQNQDHQVIPFPSARKRRWRKLTRASSQSGMAEMNNSRNSSDNVIFLSSAKVARRR